MRVSTAFNRMLDLPGASVVSVAFTGDGIVAGLRRRGRHHRCPCGARAGGYDHSVRRWRHLDLAATKLWLEAEIWRVDCRSCGRVRTEEVPWARPGARLSRDFEDVIAWLVQRTDKTSVSTLLRVSWQTVHGVVGRVVEEHLNDDRLDGIFHLGVDEVSYKRGHHYLTVIADHDTGRVVHVTKGRRQSSLSEFFELLGPERCAQVEAISMDMAVVWQAPCATYIPQAAVCFDPFHVMVWVNQALDAVYRSHRPPVDGTFNPRDWKRVGTALRSGAERLDHRGHALIVKAAQRHYELGRSWELKEDLRALYQHVDPDHADTYLRDWLAAATNSRIGPFVTLAKRIRRHFDGIVNAVRYGLSNSRIEGINAKIRLINKRGYGHRNITNLAAMIHLCLGGITITQPTQR